MTAPTECDVVLKDGTTALLRPAVPADGDRLRAFFARLSPDSVNLRYFGLRGPDQRAIDRLLAADPRDELGLLAECGGAVVALAQVRAGSAGLIARRSGFSGR